MSIIAVSSLFQFKRFLSEKGMLVHWQYLFLASVTSILGGVVWAFISLSYQMELGFIAALLGIVQGFLAFIYMPEKGDPRLIFYSLVFSLLSYFLGKYLIYVHYYDWVLNAVIDKSELSFSLLFFYLKIISYPSISDFIVFYKDTFNPYDMLWVAMIIISSLEYQLFYNAMDDDQHNHRSPRGSARRIRRRFTGQKY